MATKNEKYSAAEKRAFNAGRGYAAAKAGKRVECKSEAEKKSFREGLKSVKKGGK